MRPVLPQLLPELTSFLRKASRMLRSATLTALEVWACVLCEGGCGQEMKGWWWGGGASCARQPHAAQCNAHSARGVGARCLRAGAKRR
eukprot:349745-Chlamydomonas_euryale.AAC.3